jgi:hypothetical protein
MMHFHALISLGFLGLASGSVGVGGMLPTGPGIDASVVYAPLAKPTATAAPAGITFPLNSPSEFPFVTIVPDNGKGKAGGWQGTQARLKFTRVVIPRGVRTWFCNIAIEMPIRHSTIGYISPTAAATMSAAVTNSVTPGTNFDHPEGIFCENFRNEVQVAFPKMYPGLGVRVLNWNPK